MWAKLLLYSSLRDPSGPDMEQVQMVVMPGVAMGQYETRGHGVLVGLWRVLWK